MKRHSSRSFWWSSNQILTSFHSSFLNRHHVLSIFDIWKLYRYLQIFLSKYINQAIFTFLICPFYDSKFQCGYLYVFMYGFRFVYTIKMKYPTTVTCAMTICWLFKWLIMLHIIIAIKLTAINIDLLPWDKPVNGNLGHKIARRCMAIPFNIFCYISSAINII